MGKRKFRVTFEGDAVIELDDAVINQVDDEWRKHLYDLNTPTEIAEHIAFNFVCNHASLSQLDGWANLPDDFARIIGGSGGADWYTIEAVEEIDKDF